MTSSSRISTTLRAAREHLGWSRETLAFHSGVSWSAIAQIESGRRKDVRLSSLTALADALGVSVDFLIGTAAAVEPQLLEHRILPFASDEEFLATATPFLADGVDRSHGSLAVLPEERLGLLRGALDRRSSQVEFIEAAAWYRSPREALDRYRAFLKDRIEIGVSWITVVAEIPLQGETPAEIDAWTRYESIVNLAFATAPATIVCAYDTGSLPDDVVGDATRAHPWVAEGITGVANPSFRDPEDVLLDPPAGR